MNSSEELRVKFYKVINEFDFNQVAKAMKALDWTWGGSSQPPTIVEMVSCCWNLFDAYYENFCKNDAEYAVISSGGFKVSFHREISKYDIKVVDLEFVIEEMSSSYL
ncbi:MAG TPA: hypothetical protein DC057_02350 [Spirochaetia bacterium]|nr:hypothetical protein [Spirochaetia bacterium]